VAGPFAFSPTCSPGPQRCSGGASRSPARASRTLVRPGRKNGGTTLIFRLTRPTVLRVTIFRVYPDCKRVGSFAVRAHAGVNRVRFRGRIRGRTLPAGGYRLVVRARGAERDAAAIPIVVAHGKPSKAQVQHARTTVVCDDAIANIVLVAAASTDDPEGGTGGAAAGKLGSIAKTVTDPIVRAAGTVVGKAKDAGATLGNADRRLDNPFVLVILVLLLSVLSGCLLLAAQLAREAGYLDR
jgi:hypothetical protein